MRILTASAVAAAAPMSAWVEAAARALAAEADVPGRPVLQLPEGRLLFMPGYVAGVAAGLKMVGVFPGNSGRGLPGTVGAVLLVDIATGVPEALIDGTTLTALRTGAVTGAATARLARPDAAVLAVLGAGGIARGQVEGVCAVRPIREIRIWNRTPERARNLAGDLAEAPAGGAAAVRVAADAAEAVRGADVVVCCTGATAPVLRAAWLSPGVHVNAVGAFTPDMVEVDPGVVTGAALVAADRVDEACRTGDLAGRIDPARVLPLPAAPSRPSAADLTLFKSVGTAALDLVCARMLLERTAGAGLEVDLGR